MDHETRVDRKIGFRISVKKKNPGNHWTKVSQEA